MPKPSTSADSRGADDAIRVMVVDDSAVIRGLIARILEEDSRIRVVASVQNGQMALDTVRRREVDVIVLDIEMPVMDGLTALPKLVEAAPNVIIIMASTLTRRNAEISLRCLAEGADDYVSKPTSNSEIAGAADFKRDLISKIIGLAGSKGETAKPSEGRRWAHNQVSSAPTGDAPTYTLRKPSTALPKILAIASSTGGPQALFELFRCMRGKLRVPVLITQHMPPTFTAILAQHIGRSGDVSCKEGEQGEPLQNGHVYVAPGDYHMTLKSTDKGPVISLDQDPPVNFCRPAADPMFRSVAASFGARSLSVVLTGMGHDGHDGAQAVAAAGGTIVAQDESTSVVWGMPRAVAQAGVCSAILPLKDIGGYLTKLLEGQGQ